MSTGKKRLLAYVIMITSLLISARLVRDIVRLWNADDRINVADEELRLVTEEQLSLQKKLEKVNSGEWWEVQVRNNLKMARKNEEVVIVPEEVKKITEFERVEDLLDKEELSNLQKWQQVFGIMDN